MNRLHKAEVPQELLAYRLNEILEYQGEYDMRTSLWDIIRFAWALWRHPERQNMRIGQMICNADHANHSRLSQVPMFYIENHDLIKSLHEADVVYWSCK